ncbi:MAG: endonuclease/exonuclease/phosphatase family protein [Vicinamibacterales bacterium]
MATLRVMTYNIFYGGVGRQERIREVVKEAHPDVVVFNEVSSAESFESIAEMVGPHRAVGERHQTSGHPVIVSRWPILEKALYGPTWEPHKFVEATIQPPGRSPVRVSGVHLTPQSFWTFEVSRWREVRSLITHLRRRTDLPQIIAGDFNTLMTGDPIRRHGLELWVRAQMAVQGGWPRWALKLMGKAGYVDCYRACHSREPGFTVPAWDPGIRLDYIFASSPLTHCLAGAGTVESSAARGSDSKPSRRPLSQLFDSKPLQPLGGAPSDHLPVWANFDWPE